MMFYENNYWGMDFIWWCIWLVVLFWIFALPYQIPGQRHRKETPLDILNRRFASGEISKEEFKERKDVLMST
ncbi:SHOCT domain-containing protein [Pedobacter fastidiosus]|uniref:SHOCT domain-containing protein n=2 Tax=Pedobacter fastidiosus TaxID=2765361 RepID=A0ABR7KSA6_9SPHI|nr:SHOCT domain-containing protein [Pedobacter fastidiosus]